MTTDEKREELRERIAAGEQRNEERKELAEYAREARDSAVGFAKEHPVATVAGGLALGLLIGALTPKGRKLSRRAGGFAMTLAELGAVYATEMLDKAGDAAVAGKDRLEDLGDSMGAAARTAKRDLAYHAGSATDSALALGKRASRSSSRTMRALKGRLNH